MIIVSITGELNASMLLILICSPTRVLRILLYRRRSIFFRVVSLNDANPDQRALDLSEQNRRRSQRRPAARRIFFPNFRIINAINGASKTMNIVNFQLNFSARRTP